MRDCIRPNFSERSHKSAARIGPDGRLFFYTCDEYHCGANSLWSSLACRLFRYPASCPGLNALPELTELGRRGLGVQLNDQLNGSRHIRRRAKDGFGRGSLVPCLCFQLETLSTRTGEEDDGLPEVKLHHSTELSMRQRLHHPVLPSSPT